MSTSRRVSRSFFTVIAATSAALTLTAFPQHAKADPLPGGIYVDRIGGTAAFTNDPSYTSTDSTTQLPVFIDDFSPTGNPTAPQTTISLPTGNSADLSTHAATLTGYEGNGAVFMTDGIMQSSSNGQYLSLIAYDGTTTSTKTFTVLNAATGKLDTSLAFANSLSPRGAVTQDGANVWFTASNSGTGYVSPSSTVASPNTGKNTLITKSNVNQRTIEIYGGQLFTSGSSSVQNSGPATNPGIAAMATGNVTSGGTGGLPTSGGGSTSANFMGYLFTTASDPEQFVMLDQSPASFTFGGVNTGLDLAYVATQFGMEKWVYNGSTWSRSYSINAGLSTDNTSKLYGYYPAGNGPAGTGGLVGLTYAGKDSAGDNILYATTTGNYGISSSPEGNALVKLVDTGPSASWTVVAYSPDDSFFKGVSLVKMPGDANGDWTVDADDYSLIDRGFAQYQTGVIPANTASWAQGDFNYDGVIDSNDYLLIDKQYSLEHGGLSPDLLAQRESQFGDAYVQSLIASVPEPTSLLTACGFALPLLSRRRKP